MSKAPVILDKCQLPYTHVQYTFSQSRVPEKAILNPAAACNGYTYQILFKVRSLEVFSINFKITQALYVKYYTDSKTFLLKQVLETKTES